MSAERRVEVEIGDSGEVEVENRSAQAGFRGVSNPIPTGPQLTALKKDIVSRGQD